MIAGSLVALASFAVSQGLGLGNLTYAPAEVFTPIGLIESPEGHGNMTMVQGYLMVIYSSDGGGSPDDVDVFDSDRPGDRDDTGRRDGMWMRSGHPPRWVNLVRAGCARRALALERPTLAPRKLTAVRAL